MFVNTNNSNRPEDKDQKYNQVISQIKNDGVCPFCSDQLTKYHTNPINQEGLYWLATDNMYPYKGAKHHILFIHKEHVSSINDLTSQAWAELHTLINQEIDKRAIPGGTFFMRFGDTSYTGATVTHLHCHVVSRDLDSNPNEPILARIG